MRHYRSSHWIGYMVKQRRRVKCSKHRLRVWAMGENRNGDIKIASFAHC